MLNLKTLSTEDFQFAIRLTDTMNWNLVKEDFEFMKELEPTGCFVLLDDLTRVGIATTISYDNIGWLGNVIISERHRGKGAGSFLVKHCIDYLINTGVETVGLYSYIERVPFYRRLGFKACSEFIILNGSGLSTSVKAYPKISNKDIIEAINLDNLCFGTSREKLLKPILLDSDNLSYKSVEKGEIFGFILTKVYGDTAEIGPLVCKKGRTDIAFDLIKCTLNALPNTRVSVCIPEQESEIYNMLLNFGFVEDFRTVRMLYGTPVYQDCVYVAESLERG